MTSPGSDAGDAASAPPAAGSPATKGAGQLPRVPAAQELGDVGPGHQGPGTLPHATLPPAGATWKNRVYGMIGLLLFGAAFALSVTHVAPSLVTDWQVRGAAESVEPSEVRGGRCSVKLFVHLCDAKLSASTKRNRMTRSVHYVFVDTASGNYSVSVIADPARPALLTTDLGLDRLVNRTVTLLVIWGLLAALMFGSALTLRGPRRPAAPR